jgi:asparagine synthase (glutamine-hydrolysing)
MCGIAGFLTPPADPAEVLQMQVLQMADAIAHRGPDSAGHWVDPAHGIALGHRRLAVVDLSPQGAQPMMSHCGRYVVAFNGEIYNHADLRAELESEAGPLPWRGHSDTETLAATCARWGLVAALPRLVGMFAIAVWDRKQARLTLARDRLGEKPLYWGRLPGGTLAFGSELRALRAHARWQGEIDRDALALYLRLGAVPAPHTIHRGVHKLEPGAWVRFAHGQPDATGHWWRLVDVARQGVAARPRAAQWTDAEATDRLQALLMQAVGGQLLSDVPLGAFLSGGVDSSTIVAMMTRCAPGAVRTFCIGFDQPGFDEAAHARAVAAHLGTQHTELRVTAAEALAVVPRLPTLYDEPFADSSQIPTALVAAMARRDVTVALSGDGGDELFAGYNRYLLAGRLWRRLAPLPMPLRRLAARALLAVDAGRWTSAADFLQRGRAPARRHVLVGPKLHKLARQVLPAVDLAAMHKALASLWPDPAALVPGAQEPATAFDAAFPAGVDDAIDRMCLIDQGLYLPDDILVKVDRAAMAVALETRVPLLDHRIVEFAWQLPARLKLRDGQGKWLLRQVLYRHVPAALIERPKQGFAVPLQAWLQGPLRDWAEDLLAAERLHQDGFIHPAPVRAAWAALLAGDGQWGGALWSVLMWQAWRAEVAVR